MNLLRLIAALAASLIPATLLAGQAVGDAAVDAAIRAQYHRQGPRAALSPSERKELSEWVQAAMGRGLVPVDLADAHEVRMVDLMQKAAGRPPVSELLSSLKDAGVARPTADACASFLKEHEANGVFLDVGAARSGADAASAAKLASASGGKLSTASDVKPLTASTLQATFLTSSPDVRNFGTQLLVLDSDENPVTEGDGLSNKDETTLFVDARPAEGSVDEEHPPRASALFTVFMTDGTPCQFRRTAEVLPPPRSIEVTAPNNVRTGATKTVICLNRANPDPVWPQPCDFGPFPQASQDGRDWKVVVPLAGTIMLPHPLALKDGKIDAQLQVTAINSQSGKTCQGQDNDLGKQVFAQTNPTQDNQGVTWSILADKALIFGHTCYDQHSGLAFNMFWTIKVQKQGATKPSTVTAIVSNVLERGSANTLVVHDVDLQWGCLPAGTLVTLADRTRKKIEDITPKDLILGADQKPWEPVGKLTGDEGELIVVTAEDGTAARMTAEHPVIIGVDDRGAPRWLAASHLTVGASLVTARGASKVATIERRPYGGKVYNLALRPQGAQQPPALGASFYADGLLVGDQTMQGLPEPARTLAQSVPAVK
jgi:hypothetical protein